MSEKAKLYGTTQAELTAAASAQCYDIVQEIMTFGVSQQQITKLIHLLALELEDDKLMIDITKLTSAKMSRLSGVDENQFEQHKLIV